MPTQITNNDLILEAFSETDVISELVEKLPNGEYRNELDMDIILFGRGYRGKKVGPYARLLEFAPGETIIEENSWESGTFFLLVSGKLEASVGSGTARRILGEVPEGATFGEMALLAGTVRSASISVSGGQPARVIEFTRPALRLLRKLPKFGKSLDRSYRSYGQTLTLSEFKQFAAGRLDDETARRLGDASRFAVYEKDHVLFREGDPVNRVFFVRGGWIQRISGSEVGTQAASTVASADDAVGADFLGAGSCMGLDAVAKDGNWGYTATVKGRAEIFEIAVSRLREDRTLAEAVIPLLEAATGGERGGGPALREPKRVLAAAAKEISTGVVDAENLLVMDMAKCIRCGNCSLACHTVHGHSRLVRRGIHIERAPKPGGKGRQDVLVPEVCMHCQDPECLTGCPTGAIARFPNGEIDIHAGSCIGCGDCATQCPYNAISMVPRSPAPTERPGVLGRIAGVFSLRKEPLPAPVTATEGLLAVKCNLCNGTPLNPEGASRRAYSCEENCPTGALARVNPRESFSEIRDSIGLIKRNKTHAIGINIHRLDVRAMLLHLLGIASVLIFSAAVMAGTRLFGQDVSLTDNGWLTMRWVSGLVGLAGIAWVMAYPYRKRIYRRRAGALRYWMLSHVYLGVLAAVVLMVHGGFRSGGLLTASLTVTFDLVIASGVWGTLCYAFVPRLMTRIEREPLLLEDLEARREELRAMLREPGGSEAVKRLVAESVNRRFGGFGYLLRQYLRREDLNIMLADARSMFKDSAGGLVTSDSIKLMDAVENAATLRRIDALCYLHLVTRSWIGPHVIFTSLMLVLMVIHIAQAVYFNVR